MTGSGARRVLVGTGSLWAAIGATLLLSGCWLWSEQPYGPAITASNQTDETLEFRVFGGGEWWDLPLTLPPGQSGSVLGGALLGEPTSVTVDGCTEGDLIALTPDGREVARHPPPLCKGDNWVVTDEASPS